MDDKPLPHPPYSDEYVLPKTRYGVPVQYLGKKKREESSTKYEQSLEMAQDGSWIL